MIKKFDEMNDLEQWAIIAAVTEMPGAIEKIKPEGVDTYDVTMFINGVEVDAGRMIHRMYENFQYEVEEEAKKIALTLTVPVSDINNRLYDMLSEVENISSNIRSSLDKF